MLNPVIRNGEFRDGGGGRGRWVRARGSGTDLKYGPISVAAKNKLPQDSREKK